MTMPLSQHDYESKVYACWLGKNCGGTLGTPLEEAWGHEELFDVWWYPELREGGIPNDDLEIQLVWLQALEDRGVDITARDLADYWLDCIQYNFDEYGLHKTNLRRGLSPPLSGWHNNWFKDCMGSPIRSEIWACIAPGLPNVAAAYAYQDAILDHAGGESVYGEMFNAALQSAAFVERDRDRLLNIALGFIPHDSLTAHCINRAIDCHSEGLDWQDARQEVLRAAYSPVAQYSPVNLGFQTIGWLYGEDFGDALCKAVNCGYDTDCTGATLGALLGIMGGRESLPDRWTQPLSDTICTNVSNGGITNLREPANLGELTERVCRIGRQVLARHGDAPVSLAADDATRRNLWNASPTTVSYSLGPVTVAVDMPQGPAVGPVSIVPVEVTVRNNRLTPVVARVGLSLPDGWNAGLSDGQQMIEPGGEAKWISAVLSCPAAQMHTVNRGGIRVDLPAQPSVMDVPVVFLGANRWLMTRRLPGTLETATEFEEDLAPHGAGAGWTDYAFPGNAVELEAVFDGADGILYLRHYAYNPEDRMARVGFPSNTPFRMWMNGALIHECPEPHRLRPNNSGDGRSYVDTFLRPGWNQFMFKVERRGVPAEAHFILADAGPVHHGLYDVIQCRLPWEE